MDTPTIHELFDNSTGTWQYVVADPATSTAIIIDPVLNFESGANKITTEAADALLKIVAEKDYKVEMVLETHAHADHITAASYLKNRLGRSQGSEPLIGIGSRIKQVQELFSAKYSVPLQEYENVFDKLLSDDEEFKIGTMTAQAIHLPGHTPDHVGYKIGDNVFVGDSIFNVDLGSARADFPGGSAEAIFNSGRKLFAMPDHTKIWVGHDYPPPGRDAPLPFMTVKQHRDENKHLKDGTEQHEFIEMRKKRDEKLAAPKLMHQSLQMNIRAGRLPMSTALGDRVLNLPLKVDIEW